MSPLSLILLPIAASPLVYLLQGRFRMGRSLALATIAGELFLALQIPLGSSSQLLGRSLRLTSLDQVSLVALFSLTLLNFLHAWQNSQGLLFLPLTLIATGLASGATLIEENFVIASLLLEITVIVNAFLIQSERKSSIQASIKCLSLIMTAIPCLLVACLLMEQYLLNPDSTYLVQFVLILLSIGFGIILAAVPFQSWLPSVAHSAPPMVTSFLVSSTTIVALSLLVDVFNRFPWLITETETSSVLLIGGLVTAIGGAVLTFPQGDLGKLMGYSAVSDLGVILFGLGMTSHVGIAGALSHTINRALSLALMSIGLDNLRVNGLAQRGPFTTSCIIMGGLGLSGFPLTSAFASRWLVYGAAYEANPLFAYALVLASAGVFLGHLRNFQRLPIFDNSTAKIKESRLMTALTVLLIALSLVLGLYPQLALQPIVKALEGLAFLSRP